MHLSDEEKENIKKILDRNGIYDDITTLGPAGPSAYTASKSEFVTKTEIDRAMQEMRDEISKKSSLIAKDIDPVSAYASADLSNTYSSKASATIKTSGFRGPKSSSCIVVNHRSLKEEKVKNGIFQLAKFEKGTRVNRFEVRFIGKGISDPNFTIASIPEWLNEGDAELLAEGIYNSVVDIHKRKDKLL